jgi:hypothetical protein
MHAETLAYLLNRLPAGSLRPRDTDPHGAWDNEYEEHCVDVSAFCVASH